MPTTVIATERLILRSALARDFDQLFARVFSDAQVMKYLSEQPLEREKAKALFDEAFDHQGTGKKIGVLIERASDNIVGYAGLKLFDALGQNDFEVGFVIQREAWCKGYATEIGRAQLEHGFRTTGRSRLVAQVRPANVGSANALRKIGMSFLKEYERPNMGTWAIYVCAREA